MVNDDVYKKLKSHWGLDSDCVFLNHGSFGATPHRVLEEQSVLRRRMESQPIRFFERELPGLHDEAKSRVGAFLGAKGRDIAFVSNASSGVNTVLRSLNFAPADEILVTEFAYGACRNAVDFVAARSGASVRVAPTPFPGSSKDALKSGIFDSVGKNTRLALLDHVTSPTGLVFPLAEIVSELEGMGVDVLVDGAHAPGMVPLNIEELGASYYVGNLHKWVCAPKGAAILHVRGDRQDAIRPLVISHGATFMDAERTRFELEFEWQGTDDPTAFLCAPAALDFMGGIMPGGWPELMESNREKVLKGRSLLCDALEIDEPADSSLIGSLAAISLPQGFGGFDNSLGGALHLHNSLYMDDTIEVPVIFWPGQKSLMVRISAQAYNVSRDYERLAEALIRRR